MTIIKIEMNEEEVRAALAEHIMRQEVWNWAHIDPLDVEIEVGKTYHDRQPGMDGEPVFKKAIISIKSE